MKINQNTFCAAPWFFIRNENRGEYRVCCAIDQKSTEFNGNTNYSLDRPVQDWTNSEYMQYVRKNLTEGVYLKECKKCWQRESAGVKSLRQMTNDTITDNRGNELEKTWVINYFKHKNDYLYDLLLAADIKVDNICNFECVMCNPADSSQIYARWINQQDNEFVKDLAEKKKDYFEIVRQTYINHDGVQLLDHALESPIRFLKILGGEPLLNKKTLNKLQNLPEEKKKKISLTFVTNGSVDLVNTVRQLGNFKNIHFVVSIDAIGSLQEYIRVNCDWNYVSKNIETFIENFSVDNKKIGLSLLCTIQALNVNAYLGTENWARERNIPIDITILSEPEHLSFSILHDDWKKQIIQNLSQTNNNNIELIVTSLLNSTYNNDLKEKFVRFIKWQDPDLNLLKIDPAWKSFLID